MGNDCASGQQKRRRTRSAPLPSMVLSKKDVYNLSKVIFGEASVVGGEFIIHILSSNGMETEVHDLSVFSDADVIDTYQTKKIIIKFRSYDPFKLIVLDLWEGNIPTNLEISSDDPQWVDSVFMRLSELASSITPQSKLYFRLRGILKHVMRLSVGYVVSKIILFIIVWILIKLDVKIVEPPSSVKGYISWRDGHVYAGYIIDMIGYYFLGDIFSSGFIRRLDEMHKRTEFNFGPVCMNESKKRKSLVYAFCCTILIPIIVNMISNLIEKVIM